MIEDSSKLVKGQRLQVVLDKVEDRLSSRLLKQLKVDPCGLLIGYKMVDGNQFGFALKFSDGNTHWFFEHELLEVD